MIITELSLKNFKIHKNSQLQFSEKINYIVGGNGQGKTTILEAIYFCCTTKNYKSNTDLEFVHFGKDSYSIVGKFLGATGHTIEINYQKAESRRKYLKDAKTPGKLSEVIGKFPVVLLTPEDHSITQGYAAERRKFVDSVISQASELYLTTLLDYNRLIKQRNALLAQIKETGNPSLLSQLQAWNDSLIGMGSQLIEYRLQFVREFIPSIAHAYKQILKDKEIPNIEYAPFDEQQDHSLQEIKTRFRLKLESVKQQEIRRGVTLVGPHRDDFTFSINGNNLKKFGSQGQHKTFQVALRFAQFFYLKDKLGVPAIFLLDDVFGELDTERSVSISTVLKNIGQAFITLTDFSHFDFIGVEEHDKVFNITNGEVIAV